jgi:hypothetical protein
LPVQQRFQLLRNVARPDPGACLNDLNGPGFKLKKLLLNI